MAARPVEMSALLREVAAAAESIAQPAGIAIELDIADNLPLVTGDQAALRRGFYNPLANAIKYGPAAPTRAAPEPRPRRGALGGPPRERAGASARAHPP